MSRFWRQGKAETNLDVSQGKDGVTPVSCESQNQSSLEKALKIIEPNCKHYTAKATTQPCPQVLKPRI